jgi:hypothetical protein
MAKITRDGDPRRDGTDEEEEQKEQEEKEKYGSWFQRFGRG